MKICRTCKKELTLDNFYSEHRAPDGLQCHCKACRSIEASDRRKARSSERVKRDRERELNYRFENKERTRLAVKKSKQKNRNGHASYNRNDYQRRKLEVSVRNKTNLAIRLGKLIRKPCKYCGNLKVHAHHTDYSKPLQVEWLCSAHHAAWHRIFLPENTTIKEI